MGAAEPGIPPEPDLPDDLRHGHRPPTGTSTQQQPPIGLAGPLAPAARQVHEATLEPGDCVLLYTGGVVGARDADGAEFAVQRQSRLRCGRLTVSLDVVSQHRWSGRTFRPAHPWPGSRVDASPCGAAGEAPWPSWTSTDA